MPKVRPPLAIALWPRLEFRFGDVTISGLDDRALAQVQHTTALLPPSFSARIDRARFPVVDVDLAFATHERLRCRAVRLSVRPDDQSDSIRSLPRLPVAELVMEAAAIASFIEFVPANQEQLEGVAALVDSLLDQKQIPLDLTPEIGRGGPKRAAWRLGDSLVYPVVAALVVTGSQLHELEVGTTLLEHLAVINPAVAHSPTHLEVALEYQRAAQAGEPVTDAVQQKFHWSRPTARNRIRAARTAGYLPAARPGQVSTW